MLKDFEAETARIYELDAEKIDDEYKQKIDNESVTRRIAASDKINRSRLSKMEARERCMMKVFNEIQAELYKKITTDSKYYESILKDLIV